MAYGMKNGGQPGGKPKFWAWGMAPMPARRNATASGRGREFALGVCLQ